MSENPSYEIDAGIAWITFDDPQRKLNVLDESVMRQLAAVCEELSASEAVRVAVFRSGKRGSFIAGADVDAIADIDDPETGENAARLGQAIFRDVERLPFPTVAAIDGLCLGGGTELALACRFRVASDSPETRIGLPEVKLGILPAWGGTTRLPRLVGLQAALDMMLTGKNVSPSKARRIGLVSEILPAATFEDAVREYAVQAIDLPSGASRRKRNLLETLTDRTGPGRKLVLAAARRRVMASTGGHYPAPLRILEVLDGGLGSSVRRSLDLEARAAGELIASPVSKNLIRIFKMREAARKRRTEDPREVEHVGILGAGVMGGGIAQLMAYNGVSVRMKDIRHEAVAQGLEHARGLFDKAVKRGKMNRREADHAMDLIFGDLEYHGFARTDLVIEAVVENLEVKKKVLREVEEHVGDECILTTNTSSLSIDEMAKVLSRPARFLGLHFFNPVHRMPLVEIVRGQATDDTVVDAAHALAVRLGKVPVIVADGPGFLVNRILAPYLNEAGWLLEDGASIEDVDAAAEDFGMPMGPLRLLDEVGIDVARHAGDTMHEALGERLAPPATMEALERSERLGKKNGIGFYTYDGGEAKDVDDGVYRDLGLPVPGTGAGPDARLIRARLVLAMVNEASRVLDEGLVPHADAIDLGMVMGAGFPPFRGGLLRFADAMGLGLVLERLEHLSEEVGRRFTPSDVIRDLAGTGATFHGTFPA